MRVSQKLLHWLPRIICIASILFVSMCGLDAFDSDLTFLQKMRDLFLHLIPSFVLLGILILSWRKELIGGILFVLVGIIFSVLVFHVLYFITQSVWATIARSSILTFPFILVGILFILDSYKTKA